jgi:hypothetical protein
MESNPILPTYRPYIRNHDTRMTRAQVTSTARRFHDRIARPRRYSPSSRPRTQISLVVAWHMPLQYGNHASQRCKSMRVGADPSSEDGRVMA